MTFASNDAALEAHATFPSGKVYLLLSNESEQAEDVMTPRDRKREYNHRRAEAIRAYAKERGITVAAARVELRKLRKKE